MLYFDDPSKDKALGSFDLRGCAVMDAEEETKKYVHSIQLLPSTLFNAMMQAVHLRHLSQVAAHVLAAGEGPTRDAGVDEHPPADDRPSR